MLRSNLVYDLHIHSCLSPCGENDSLPSNIIGMSKLSGLDVIAITDHNSCKNCPAAIKLGMEYEITVIPGMELTTSEEVHVVCLFPHLEAALEFDKYVYKSLPRIKNRSEIFGNQYIVDENDNIIGEEPYLLINATSISFDKVSALVHSHNGIAFPAHIDKSANSLLANLGFIPPDSTFTVAEVKHIGILDRLIQAHPYLKQCRILHNSDAHTLEQVALPENPRYSLQLPRTLTPTSMEKFPLTPQQVIDFLNTPKEL